MNQEEIMQQLQAAVALHNQGELDRAEAIYRQVLAVDANNFFALNFSGCICREKKRFDEGIDLLSRAVSLQPGNPDAVYNLGNVFKDAERLDDAISCYEKALRLRAEYPEALNNLGMCLKEVDRYEHAEIVLKRAVSMQPGLAGAWLNLGNTLKEQEKFEESIASYRKAIEMKPNFAGAWLNLGNTLKEQEKFEESIASYRKAIEVKPDFADAWLNLGNTLKEQEKFKESIASYRKAIEVKPDFADAYFNLGNVLKEEGELVEAIASYRKATEVRPDFLDAYFQLGVVCMNVGSLDEVRQIINTLRQMKSLEDEASITFQDKILVFDWHYRRALDLSWKVELAAAGVDSSPLAAVKQVDSLCFPPLFLGDQTPCAELKMLYENGYLVDEGIVSSGVCAQFISQFNDVNEPMSAELVEAVLTNGVLRSVLEKILLHTGFPHLVWNCAYFAKGPDDEEVSDAWHYDNHYNIWTPKLMVYLNSQSEERGATHFVDQGLSRQLSEKSEYVGLVFQRELFANRVKELVEELNIDPVTLDPEYYVFSPEKAGAGVWFCPARALHRGVSPVKGVRHVLSFSLTPLPADCGWSVDQCLEKSVEILQDKIKKGMQKADINPYWIAAQFGSD